MRYFSRLLLFFCFIAFSSLGQHQLPKLGYSYGSLEPFIDSTTMFVHYSNHHGTYINNLNEAVKGTEAAKLSVEEIFKNMDQYNEKIRNNAGGHYNHTLFWEILTPQKNTKPSAHLAEAIREKFGNLDSLKTRMNKQALKRFGSGWVWLYVDSDKKLQVSSTPNQDNPLMSVVQEKGIPILGIDVWEHAYYLKYQNKRGDYLAAIWNVINWNEVSRKFENIVPKGKFEDWAAMKEFYKVMSETFHPSEQGDLKPIRARSAEMLALATDLSKSKIPSVYDTKQIKKAIAELASGSKKLDKMVKVKAKDEPLKKSLADLHHTFHKIVGLCSETKEKR